MFDQKHDQLNPNHLRTCSECKKHSIFELRILISRQIEEKAQEKGYKTNRNGTDEVLHSGVLAYLFCGNSFRIKGRDVNAYFRVRG